MLVVPELQLYRVFRLNVYVSGPVGIASYLRFSDNPQFFRIAIHCEREFTSETIDKVSA